MCRNDRVIELPYLCRLTAPGIYQVILTLLSTSSFYFSRLFCSIEFASLPKALGEMMHYFITREEPRCAHVLFQMRLRGDLLYFIVQTMR